MDLYTVYLQCKSTLWKTNNGTLWTTYLQCNARCWITYNGTWRGIPSTATPLLDNLQWNLETHPYMHSRCWITYNGTWNVPYMQRTCWKTYMAWRRHTVQCNARCWITLQWNPETAYRTMQRTLLITYMEPGYAIPTMQRTLWDNLHGNTCKRHTYNATHVVG